MAKSKKSQKKPPARRSGSRARARPPVVDRVRHIAELMSTGRWSAKLALELADTWACSLSAVQTASAEASRAVRGALGSPDEIRAKLFGHLEEAIELARLDEHPGSGAKAIVAAVESFAKISGVLAPVKVAATDTKGNDAPSWLAAGIDPRQVLAFVAAHGRPPTAGELEGLREAQPGQAVKA